MSMNNVKIPNPITPRPGEEVIAYAGQMRLEGKFVGYTSTDDLKIDIDGNQQLINNFLKVRPKDPFNRKAPNWTDCEIQDKIHEVPEEQIEKLQGLIRRGISGMTYLDLIKEIYLRGYEIYCVGGTIRDVIRGDDSNDIDLVTTMPIHLLEPLLDSMFGDNNYSRAPEFGFINIASKGTKKDPTIDLKNFFLFAPGSKLASFGSNIFFDSKLRDFACNSIYYDPMNNKYIDPTGYGIQDAKDKKLRLVKDLSIPHPEYNSTGVPLRFFKFVLRGFTYTEETLNKIQKDYLLIFEKAGHLKRISEFNKQFLKKNPKEVHLDIIEKVKELMIVCGCGNIWNLFYANHIDDLKNIKN